MRLPKVLILGQPFNDFTGGGITLSNLFHHWNKDSLAVACVPHLLDRVDNKICDNYYQLGEKEHTWKFPFRLLQRKFISGRLSFQQNEYKGVPRNNKARKGMVEKVLYPILTRLGLFHIASALKPSPDFFRWVDNFQPDILYVQVSTRKDFAFTNAVFSHLKIPMIIHVMDDWPSTISSKGMLKKYWFRKIDDEFRALLKKASLLLTISEHMSEEYQYRYGRNFTAFHNPVDINIWKDVKRTDVSVNQPPSILYAGRIGIGIDSSLKFLAEAIEAAGRALSTKIKFIIQTQEPALWFKEFDCVVHEGYKPYAEVPKAIAQSDCLVLPYDFSKESREYFRFSMPTKAPEFMISGVPILIFAPADTALVKFARHHQVAAIVTESNVDDLRDSIIGLLQDAHKRKSFSENAMRVAEEHFDSIKVRQKFTNTIKELVA